MFSFNRNKKRKISGVLVFLIIFVSAFGYLLKPKPVYAQGPVVVTENIPQRIGNALKGAASMALMQFVSKFIDKIAYDAAKAITGGGKGQKPLMHQKTFGNYLADTASQASATAINQVMQKQAGFGICEMPDPQFKIGLKLGLRDIFTDEKGPQLDCSWTEVANSWSLEKFKERNPALDPQNADQQFIESFKDNVSVSKSGFGAQITAIGEIGRLRAEKKEGKMLQRMEGEGFKAVKDVVSGKIKTPAQQVGKEAPTAKERRQMKAQGLFATLGNDSLQALLHGVSVFVNTLAGDLLKELTSQSGGLVQEGGGTAGGFSNEFAGPGAAHREAAERAFSFLISNPPSVQLNQLNIVNKFSTCPPEPQIRGKHNCVVGSGLQQVIQQAKTGNPMTLKEAVEQGFLDPSKPLIPPEHALDKTRNCYKQGFCYSNVKKLRKARILPLGFEIAALNADADRLSWTLGKLMNNFQDCNREGGPMRDSNHPFCHLIDPNWVIKAPETMCVGNETPGPLLKIANSDQRRRSCKNIQTCIKQNPDGSCKSYGYCRKEENVWRLPGKSCPAQYNTCTTYFNEEGQAQSYLSRTINFGKCNPANVGCRAYSLEKKNGRWLTSAEGITDSKQTNDQLKQNGRNKTIHFDNDLRGQSCSEDNWGCTGFFPGNVISTTPTGNIYRKESEKVYIKEAPAYLGCYDSDSTTAAVERPQTITQAKLARSNNKKCSQFAGACVEKEVGCKDWQAVNKTGEAIPAKIGENSCPRECAGYDTFRQRETIFSPAVSQQHFIPSDAEQCSAQAEGCSEFTNMAKPAAGGENLEYYTDLTACENPQENNQNQKTFYTWEGSADEGFQLKRHNLAIYFDNDPNAVEMEDDYDYLNDLLNKPTSTIIATGSPKYNSDRKEILNDYYRKCNEEAYKKMLQNPQDPEAADPDCRAFYDQKGKVYYRLESKVLTVSDQCHNLRKTETNLAVNEDITQQDICEAREGSWNQNTSECEVCRSGGSFQNGHCIYKTISTPAGANSCSAQFKGCRAYEGTTAGNVSIVFEDGFEPADNTTSAIKKARENWTASNNSAQIVNAALQPQLHSLKSNLTPTDVLRRSVDTSTLSISKPEDIKKQAYELTFWARGQSMALRVDFVQEDNQGNFNTVDSFTLNPSTDKQNPVSISGSWQRYKVGPTTFSGSKDKETYIQFKQTKVRRGSRELFIDNVKLTERRGAMYLIKDSWKREVEYQGSQLQADVPLSCDADPTDVLPGGALGCTLYEDSLGNQQTAVEFERLCRPAAVGCRAVYRSHNSQEETEVWYKVKAEASNKGDTAKVIINYTEDGQNKTKEASCETRPEEKVCYIDKIVFPEKNKINNYNQLFEDHVASSTIVVPQDDAIGMNTSTASEAIFLTDKKEFRCSQREEGCSKVAKEKQYLPEEEATSSYKFTSEEFVLNNPDEYTKEGEQSGTLCRKEVLGCQKYSSENETTYFKNPEIAGGKTCSYKEGISVKGQPTEVNGWFKDNIGVCEYDSSKPNASDLNQREKLCNTGSDCTVGSVTGTCKYKGTVPCYENAQTLEGNYKIWSNQSEAYDGFVGRCPASQNKCTELIERSDKSPQHPNGKPYYRIFNRDLEDASAACGGQVSRKQGCVLFDRTDTPEQKYNTEKTYEKSRKVSAGGAERFSLVDPVTTGDTDADTILQVQQDRQCKEWWSCSDQKRVFRNGKPELLCTDFKLCNQATESGECANPVNVTGIGYCKTEPEKNCSGDDQCKEECVINPQALTEQAYVNRDTSFSGWDYSGHSILNMYNVNDFLQLSFSDLTPESDISKYLVYKVPDFYFTSNTSTVNPHGEFFEKSCQEVTEDQGDDNPNNDVIEDKEDWSKCGVFPPQGRCYKGMCIKPIKTTQSFPKELDENTLDEAQSTSSVFRRMVKPSITGASCKIHPEENSPYPQTVLQGIEPNMNNKTIKEKLKTTQRLHKNNKGERYEFIRKKSDFQRANVCQEGDCSCVYKKVEYSSSIVDYWSYQHNIDKNRGVCISGSNKGEYCSSDSDCDSGNRGRCSMPESINQHIGTLGYCLERDNSIRVNGGVEELCTTWLPIQTSASTIDIFNNDPNAGYYPSRDADSSGGKVYAKNATDRGQQVYETFDVKESAESIPTSESSIDRFVIGDNNGPNRDGIGAFDLDGWLGCVQNNVCRASNSPDDYEKDVDLHDQNTDTGMGLYRSNDALFRVSALSYSAGGNALDNDSEIGGLYGGSGPSGISFYNPNTGNGRSDEWLGVKRILNCDDDFHLSFFQRYLCNDITGIDTGTIDKIDDKNKVQNNLKDESIDLTQKNFDSIGQIQDEFISLMNLYAWRFFNSSKSSGYVPNSRLLRLELSGSDNYADTSGSNQINLDTSWGYTRDSIGAGDRVGLVPADKGDSGTASWSDGTNHPYNNNKTDTEHLYTSSAETELIEEELQKVTFVPLRFPAGQEGVTPPIGYHGWHIDFSRLKKDSISVLKIDGKDVKDKQLDSSASNKGNCNNQSGKGLNDSGPNYPCYGNKQFNLPGKVDSDGKVVQFVLNKSQINNPPNETARRYIAVFYHKDDDNSLPFTTGVSHESQNPPSGSDSPFVLNNCSAGSRNWFAIGMDFDKNGEFLGYISRACQVQEYWDGDDGNHGKKQSGIQLAVIGEYFDRATDYSTVYNENNLLTKDSTNKAFTNRVWDNSKYKLEVGAGELDNLVRKTTKKPFGSTNMNISTVSTTDKDLLSKTVFNTGDQNRGVPYKCSTDMLSGNAEDPHDFTDTCTAQTYLSSDLRGDIASIISSDDTPEDVLQNLFAKSFLGTQIDIKNDNKITLTGADPNTSEYDISGNVIQTMRAPTVYSLNPTTPCGETKKEFSNKDCEPAEVNNISVNKETGFAKDYDDDGVLENAGQQDDWDGLIGVGNFKATTRFFAFADKNRMPVRRVAVHWGDEDITNNMDKYKVGLYKNRKPFCGDSSADDVAECYDPSTGEFKGITCAMEKERGDEQCQIISNDEWYCANNNDTVEQNTGVSDNNIKNQTPAHFSNASRACQDSFAQRRHTYNCGPGDQKVKVKNAWVEGIDVNSNGRIEATEEEDVDGDGDTVNQEIRSKLLEGHNLSAENDEVCVYQPKVQVLDNWGWCNGRCDSDENGSLDPGCYNDTSGRNAAPKCNEGIKKDSNTNEVTQDPWTHFKGKIIIIPGSQ